MKAQLPPIGRLILTRTLLLWVALAIACVIMAVRLFGQGDRVTTKKFMREKLDHSQNILKALTEEDYFTIAKDAKRLSAMTRKPPGKLSKTRIMRSTASPSAVTQTH